jgi:urease accessory protein
MIPDPVQAFAGSRYVQRQEFWLAPDSGLVLVDWLCSGRTALQERWQFCHFHSQNEVILGESRVLLDSLLLDPADGPLEDAYRVGRFNCMALVLLIGEPLRLASSRLLDEIGKAPVARHAALAYSASPIADGALVRLAGESVEEVALHIRRLLGFIPEILLENPWLRKW